MIISASYTTALSVASTNNWVLSPLNPAIALAEITMSLNKVSEMNWVWIFLTFGWLGSILAVVLFEFVFRLIHKYIEMIARFLFIIFIKIRIYC